MNWQAFLWGLVGFLLTVMVLSYLIGDNFFFRLASALFVGLTAGYSAVLILDQILGPHLWNPLISGSWPTRLLTLVPLILIGLLALSQFSRFTKLGTIPLAFLGGLVAALTIGGAVFGTLVPQAEAVINRFDLELWRGGKASAWVQIVEALTMLLGTVTTLSYFHFSRRKPTTPGEKLSERPKIMVGLGKMGQVFIGITLGAIFAGVFSTALFALINRISFITQFFARWIGGL